MLGVASAMVFATYGALWLTNLRTPVLSAKALGRPISFGLLLVPLVINVVAFQGRDADELLSAGLSSQNIVQIIGVGFSAAWAGWLVIARRVRLMSLVTGPAFWATFLIIVYALTSIWSVWPVLTGFRSVELAAALVLGVHVFSSDDWLRWVKRYLLAAVGLGLVSGIVFMGAEAMSGFPPFGVLRANTGGLLAFMLLFLALHERIRRTRESTAFPLLLAVASAYAFGSLASVLAATAALPLLFIHVVRPWVRRLVLLSAGGLVVVLGVWLTGQSVTVVDSIVEWAAAWSGKRPELILSLSGRAPLWQAIAELTRFEPLGMGFAAAERLLTVSLVNVTAVGWSATTAHSGYVSAWLGAGVLGLGSVVALLLALSARAAYSQGTLAPLVLGASALLAINNLTIIGVGGIASPAWVLLVALCVAPMAGGKTHPPARMAVRATQLLADGRASSGRRFATPGPGDVATVDAPVRLRGCS